MTFRTLIMPGVAFFMLSACAPAENSAEGGTAASPESGAPEGENTTDMTEPSSCAVVDSRNWHAWVDVMPGPDSAPRLHVSGEVDMPTPGYVFEWREGAADRSATPVQRLILEATPPDGMTAQVITPEQVKYEGPAIARMYRGVIVLCGGAVLADLPDVSITE